MTGNPPERAVHESNAQEADAANAASAIDGAVGLPRQVEFGFQTRYQVHALGLAATRAAGGAVAGGARPDTALTLMVPPATLVTSPLFYVYVPNVPFIAVWRRTALARRIPISLGAGNAAAGDALSPWHDLRAWAFMASTRTIVTCTKTRLLSLFDDQLQLLATLKLETPVLSLAVDETRREIAGASVGAISVWRVHSIKDANGTHLGWTMRAEPRLVMSGFQLGEWARNLVVVPRLGRLYGSVDRSVMAYQLDSGQAAPNGRFRNVLPMPVSALAYDLSTQYLVIAGTNGDLVVYNSQRLLAHVFHDHTSAVVGICIVPNPHGSKLPGQLLAASRDGLVTMHDLGYGRLAHSMHLHEELFGLGSMSPPPTGGRGQPNAEPHVFYVLTANGPLVCEWSCPYYELVSVSAVRPSQWVPPIRRGSASLSTSNATVQFIALGADGAAVLLNAPPKSVGNTTASGAQQTRVLADTAQPGVYRYSGTDTIHHVEPCGTFLLAGMSSGSVAAITFDPQDGMSLRCVSLVQTCNCPVIQLRSEAVGGQPWRLATLDAYYRLKLWNVVPSATRAGLCDLACCGVLELETSSPITFINVDFTARLVMYATAQRNLVSVRWRPPSGAALLDGEVFSAREEDLHSQPCSGFYYCAPLQLLATCAADSTVHVWSPSDWTLVADVAVPEIPTAVSIDPATYSLNVASEKRVVTFPVASYLPRSLVQRLGLPAVDSTLRDDDDDKVAALDRAQLPLLDPEVNIWEFYDEQNPESWRRKPRQVPAVVSGDSFDEDASANEAPADALSAPPSGPTTLERVNLQRPRKEPRQRFIMLQQLCLDSPTASAHDLAEGGTPESPDVPAATKPANRRATSVSQTGRLLRNIHNQLAQSDTQEPEGQPVDQTAIVQQQILGLRTLVQRYNDLVSLHKAAQAGPSHVGDQATENLRNGADGNYSRSAMPTSAAFVELLDQILDALKADAGDAGSVGMLSAVPAELKSQLQELLAQHQNMNAGRRLSRASISQFAAGAPVYPVGKNVATPSKPTTAAPLALMLRRPLADQIVPTSVRLDREKRREVLQRLRKSESQGASTVAASPSADSTSAPLQAKQQRDGGSTVQKQRPNVTIKGEHSRALGATDAQTGVRALKMVAGRMRSSLADGGAPSAGGAADPAQPQSSTEKFKQFLKDRRKIELVKTITIDPARSEPQQRSRRPSIVPAASRRASTVAGMAAAHLSLDDRASISIAGHPQGAVEAAAGEAQVPSPPPEPVVHTVSIEALLHDDSDDDANGQPLPRAPAPVDALKPAEAKPVPNGRRATGHTETAAKPQKAIKSLKQLKSQRKSLQGDRPVGSTAESATVKPAPTQVSPAAASDGQARVKQAVASVRVVQTVKPPNPRVQRPPAQPIVSANSAPLVPADTAKETVEKTAQPVQLEQRPPVVQPEERVAQPLKQVEASQLTNPQQAPAPPKAATIVQQQPAKAAPTLEKPKMEPAQLHPADPVVQPVKELARPTEYSENAEMAQTLPEPVEEQLLDAGPETTPGPSWSQQQLVSRSPGMALASLAEIGSEDDAEAGGNAELQWRKLRRSQSRSVSMATLGGSPLRSHSSTSLAPNSLSRGHSVVRMGSLAGSLAARDSVAEEGRYSSTSRNLQQGDELVEEFAEEEECVDSFSASSQAIDSADAGFGEGPDEFGDGVDELDELDDDGVDELDDDEADELDDDEADELDEEEDSEQILALQARLERVLLQGTLQVPSNLQVDRENVLEMLLYTLRLLVAHIVEGAGPLGEVAPAEVTSESSQGPAEADTDASTEALGVSAAANDEEKLEFTVDQSRLTAQDRVAAMQTLADLLKDSLAVLDAETLCEVLEPQLACFKSPQPEVRDAACTILPTYLDPLLTLLADEEAEDVHTTADFDMELLVYELLTDADANVRRTAMRTAKQLYGIYSADTLAQRLQQVGLLLDASRARCPPVASGTIERRQQQGELRAMQLESTRRAQIQTWLAGSIPAAATKVGRPPTAYT